MLESKLIQEREAGLMAHTDISEAVKKLLLAAAYTTGFGAEVTVCVTKDTRCQFFSYPPSSQRAEDDAIRSVCLLKSCLPSDSICDEFFKLDSSPFSNNRCDSVYEREDDSLSGEDDFVWEEDNSLSAEEMALLEESLYELDSRGLEGEDDSLSENESCVWGGDNSSSGGDAGEDNSDYHGETELEGDNSKKDDMTDCELTTLVKAELIWGDEPEQQVPAGKCSSGVKRLPDVRFWLGKFPDNVSPSNSNTATKGDQPTDHETVTDSHNLNIKPFQCAFCGKEFRNSNQVQSHERIHTGEKPFICSICGRRYANKVAARVHEAQHTAEKPFQCTYCGLRSFTKNRIINHERIHTGEKPFSCDICGKSFHGKTQLRTHERRHRGVKPFKCSFCEMMFGDRQGARIHERTHTGERPYKCSYCDKSFSRINGRKVHERIHTGEKPFPCSFCGKRFAQKHVAQSHERTNHGASLN